MIEPLNVPVRFFIWDYEEDSDNQDFVECTEAVFLASESPIEYERHTIRENGVSQICLTRNPFTNC